MEPFNLKEEVICFEMVNRVIVEALYELNQNTDTHMKTVNQESFNEIQVDGEHGVPSSIEMYYHNSQCEPINFRFPAEFSQENVSLEKHQIESVNNASFPISTEEDLCNDYPLDLDSLRFDWEEYTSSELQSQNENYAIEQPSSSNVVSSNLNLGNSPNHTVEKSYTCKICNKKFPSKSRLEQHMLSHTGDKPFSCNFCNKHFSLKCNLRQHMRIHTGYKPFSCSVCNKQFTQNSNLRVHMRIHTKEKLFMCRVCGHKFISKGNLQSHMVTHTGEKPHICYICKREFTQRCSLKRHMVTHTGEKPYICDICKREFTQINSLKRHMLTHVKPKVFKG